MRTWKVSQLLLQKYWALPISGNKDKSLSQRQAVFIKSYRNGMYLRKKHSSALSCYRVIKHPSLLRGLRHRTFCAKIRKILGKWTTWRDEMALESETGKEKRPWAFDWGEKTQLEKENFCVCRRDFVDVTGERFNQRAEKLPDALARNIWDQKTRLNSGDSLGSSRLKNLS